MQGMQPVRAIFCYAFRVLAPGPRQDSGFAVNVFDNDTLQYLCYARSGDGVHWEKPSLGLYEWRGSTDNNILMGGSICHNFTPMLDTNPACPEDMRIKAVAGTHPALYAFASADGLHFHRISDQPALTLERTRYGFDSQNVIFYDGARGVYCIYSRFFSKEGVRCIERSESVDCIHWSTPVPNVYTAGQEEHLYTNATTPCPGAEHMLFSFPMRFAEGRARPVVRGSRGVSDAVFMTSRDGHLWDRRFQDSLIDGGLDERSWTQRSNMPVYGLLDMGDEFSLYVMKRYSWEDACLVRCSVRPHGFAALHAGAQAGTLRTKPIVFAGSALRVNFATSATGGIRFALIDPATGEPFEGFSFDDCAELFGNALREEVHFAGGSLAPLSGRPVILAVSTNDGLGANAKSIGLLLNTRHYYFVPFGQDDPQGKENSLVARMELIPETVEMALEGKRMQPQIRL